MHALLFALILTAAPDARARLEKELAKQLARAEVSLREDKPNELTVVVALDAFERLDPLWKILYSVTEESKRKDAPLFRVELIPHKEQRVCLQHEELTRGYLFKKQRADPARISVWGNCAAGTVR